MREATSEDLPAVSAVLADAFDADPIVQWLIPSPRGRPARLRRMFGLELEHYVFPAGRVVTTEDCRGACLELPPGAWQPPRTVSGRVALSWLRVFGRRLGQATETEKTFERGHLQEPHYYVRYVGVATRFQGQGLGAALLGPTLDRCDREGLPAYLEASSDRNAALYERLGFVHLGQQRLTDGPPYWPMRRPPAAQSAATNPA